MDPKPEILQDLILKFRNLQVTSKIQKDERVPSVSCCIDLIEIRVNYIFRSLKKNNTACFGVVSKIGKNKDIVKYALELHHFWV